MARIGVKGRSDQQRRATVRRQERDNAMCQPSNCSNCKAFCGTNDWTTRILKGYQEFIPTMPVLLAKTEQELKDLAKLARKAIKDNDYETLQGLGVEVGQKQRKIAKLDAAIRRVDEQNEAIEKALGYHRVTGDYGLDFAQATIIISGFSDPEKMPGYGWSIPASLCITGAALAKIAGSVCEKCYAKKGNYNYIEVLACLWRRANALRHTDLFVEAFSIVMSTIYGKASGKGKDFGYFRWHDSGDLQSVEHLSAIVEIAKRFPQVSFWIPTKERQIVANYMKLHGNFPSNLVVRVSMARVGQKAKQFHGLSMSTVGVDDEGFQCNAPRQNGFCRKCRACWKKEVISTNYPLH